MTARRAGGQAGWPLQAWVALLVLAVTLPLGALVFWNAGQAARADEAAARREVERLARQMATETQIFLEETRALLARTARRPEVVAMGSHGCPPLFAGFREQFPRYANLLLADRQGRALCSTVAADPGEDHRASPWFLAVMDGAEDAIDRPRPGRAGARWTVVVASPVRSVDGTFAGALAVAIDLRDFPIPMLRSVGLPEGAAVGIVDGAGTIVARSSQQERIGGPARPQVLEALRRGGRDAVTVRADDGANDLVAFAPVPDADWVALALYPAHLAVEPSRRALERTLAIGLGVLLAVWAVAAVGTRRVLRRIGTIAAAADAVGTGDRRVRVEPGGPLEVARIGESFNRMLDQQARDEAALRESEQRYRALFETSPDAVLGTDAESRIVFANQAIEPLSGWRPAELVGRDLGLLQPSGLRERHALAMERMTDPAAGHAMRRSLETRLLHRDGREIPIEVTFTRAAIGGEHLFVGFLRDTSERQAALASLRESEQRFRAMADSAPVMMWVSDAAGRTAYFNATWLAFRGCTLDAAVAGGWADGVHPDDAPALASAWREGLAGREGATVEYRRMRHDGAYRWLLETRAPRFTGDGHFLGFVGSAVDIHDRVLAEGRIRRLTALYGALSQANEAIARSRDLRALLQQVCDIVVQETGIATAAVALADADGALLRNEAASGRCREFFARLAVPVGPAPAGLEPPGSVAMRSGAPVVSNDRERDTGIAQIGDDAVRRELRSTAVFPLRRAGRPAGVFAVYAALPGYFDDELMRLLGVLAADLSYALESHADRERRDAAEAGLKRLNVTLEERVAERTRSLEAATREMEAFSYSVSHDLRAPLRSIGGFADLLREGYASRLDEAGRHYLDRVKAASVRMARLIDDLLDLSRIARQEIRRSDVDLSALAAEIVEELRASAPDRDVEVAIEPGLAAHVDPGLVRIVLDNLLGNAWKFTSCTSGARIEFASATRGGRPAFVVRDNGAGLDLAFADKLFAPFQRLHTEREYPGTGIGLAIVQRIVHRHGGEVGVEAAPGRGAAFTFSFGESARASERAGA
ncbi:MAG: hypothetical protein BroJett026_20600 [Betaproteobacteria bacterium]|nr:MAG: hypothetical protein BroJett026_20600 [Betaproteobacteria bacterium]